MDFHDVFVKFMFELSLLAIPVVAGFLVNLLRVWAKEKLSTLEANKPSLYWALQKAAEMAVLAAEQAEVAGFVDDKKQYALNIVQKKLDAEGWEDFDIDLIEAAIESEVKKQFG